MMAPQAHAAKPESATLDNVFAMPSARATRRTQTSSPRPMPMTTAPFTRREIGASPRVRGTHFIPELLQKRRRFIPACAGNAARQPIQAC